MSANPVPPEIQDLFEFAGKVHKTCYPCAEPLNDTLPSRDGIYRYEEKIAGARHRPGLCTLIIRRRQRILQIQRYDIGGGIGATMICLLNDRRESLVLLAEFPAEFVYALLGRNSRPVEPGALPKDLIAAIRASLRGASDS